MNASDLARLVGGTLHGPDREFSGVAPIESAGPDHAAYATGRVPAGCQAGVLLARGPEGDRTVVAALDPKLAFIQLLGQLFPETHDPAARAAGYPGAHVHPSAQIGPGAVIYPGVYVGAGCVVGEGTVLFPNAVLYPGASVGRYCRIHAGVVLGADGFSYHATPQGAVKVPQVGRCVVEDHVEIGANSTVDRAFLEETRIGAGSKLDNLVHVGHNSQLGRSVIIAAQTGISGSCTIGDGCLIGGQAGLADHAELGPGAQLGARAAAHGKLAGGQAYLGVPAMPIALARRVMAVSRHLPEMWQLFRRLRSSDSDGA